MECFKCGASSEKVMLYEAISPEGVVPACRGCCEDFNYPVLNKVFNKVFEKPFENSSVKKVLNKISGVNVETSSFNTGSLPPQEKQLKEIVDNNLKDRIEANLLSNENLIDNFHWLIMRKRRLKKMTQKNLAESIEEPEIVISMAEKGKISKESPLLIDKLEKYFSIKLRKQSEEEHKNTFLLNNKGFETIPKEELSLPLDKYSSKHVTIGELRQMKQAILSNKKEPPKKEFQEVESELDQKDIDDLIFGRK